MMGLSKCEIKEALPLKVYKSEAAAKNGLEFFVNQEGQFVRAFENLLLRKDGRFQPLFDRLELQVPADSVVSVVVQFRQKQSAIQVKLFDSLTSDVAHEPLLRTEAVAAGQVVEQQTTFRLSANKEYYLFVFYEG